MGPTPWAGLCLVFLPHSLEPATLVYLVSPWCWRLNLAPAFGVKGNLPGFFEYQISTLALSSHTLDLTLTFCAVLGLKPGSCTY